VPAAPGIVVDPPQERRATGLITRHSSLSTDLDWIVMKCLEKDRARRYGSASELAADLKHHLANEPVSAGPPSAVYRARKFVRRHRLGVATASMVLTSILAGLFGVTYGLIRAVRAERKARFEAETTSQISQFMLGMFEINDPSEARGRSITAKEILDRAAERIRSEMADRPAQKARLLEAIDALRSAPLADVLDLDAITELVRSFYRGAPTPVFKMWNVAVLLLWWADVYPTLRARAAPGSGLPGKTTQGAPSAKARSRPMTTPSVRRFRDIGTFS
jgi:hypothetical protein